jgi:hypothetical protein
LVDTWVYYMVDSTDLDGGGLLSFLSVKNKRELKEKMEKYKDRVTGPRRYAVLLSPG